MNTPLNELKILGVGRKTPNKQTVPTSLWIAYCFYVLSKNDKYIYYMFQLSIQSTITDLSVEVAVEE